MIHLLPPPPPPRLQTGSQEADEGPMERAMMACGAIALLGVASILFAVAYWIVEAAGK